MSIIKNILIFFNKNGANIKKTIWYEPQLVKYKKKE